MTRFFSTFFFLALSSPLFAGIGVYLSPPDIQTSIDSAIMGTVTEDFNSRTPGDLGTYFSAATGITYSATSGTTSFLDNDLYGGYAQSEYLGVKANSSVTLNFAAPVEYFGLYFTAADAFNTIQIYSGNTLLLNFPTATLLANLPRDATVQAIDGSIYQTNDYYGQPTVNLNPSETYAYLHFITTAGTTFDRVVLSQAGSAIFENDNHSLLTTAPAIPGSLVVVSVPEPTPFALGGLGGVGLAVLFWRRRS